LAKKLLLYIKSRNKRTVGGGVGLKNFDEWTKELSKAVFAQADEDDGKSLLKPEEILVDDDLDEE
jgi:hypothetical protein